MRSKHLLLSLLLCSPFLFAQSSWAWIPLVTIGRCQKTGSVCRTTIGNAGGGGACCDPRYNLQQCVKDNSCQSPHHFKWAKNASPVEWYFSPNSMPGQMGFTGKKTSDLEAALKKAWDAWTKPSCTSFRHKYKGQTSRQPSMQDQVVVMFFPTYQDWVKLGLSSGVLAFSIPITDDKGKIRDGDIVFNPSPGGVSWGIPQVAKSEIDFTVVAIHEIGHSIGFAHSEQSNAVMHFQIKGLGSLSKKLTIDDQTAICVTYPAVSACKTDAQCPNCKRCSQGKCSDKNAPSSKYCKVCASDKDCGANHQCAQTAEGKRCIQFCDKNECCPSGSSCKTLQNKKLCVPTEARCPDQKCQTAKDCSSKEVCQSNICRNSKLPELQLCKKGCKEEKDCGAGNTCILLAGKRKRCVMKCISGVFCAKEFRCQKLNNEAVCLPKNEPFCPCEKDSHCSIAHVCKAGACRRQGGGKETDPCSTAVPCSQGFLCVSTGVTKQCLMVCGTTYPYLSEGKPGAPCRLDQSCSKGTECTKTSNGAKLCLKPCKTLADCNKMGTCEKTASGGTHCSCLNPSECPKNHICYNADVRSGNGACFPKPRPQKCKPGYKCYSYTVDFGICLTPPNRGFGQSCDSFSRCKAGLICLKSDKEAGASYCFERCRNSSSKCKFGGVCSKHGKGYVCLCTADNECKDSRSCKAHFSTGGICFCKQGKCAECSNNICEENLNEHCGNCLQDCPCIQGKQCRNNFCAGFCGNQICEPNENCGNCPDCSCDKKLECKQGRCQTVCGNDICNFDENCGTCSQDCKCPVQKLCKKTKCEFFCGNGVCDKGEHCENCKEDCGCNNRSECRQKSCHEKIITKKNCGNKKCEVNKGEGCFSCPIDCGCEKDEVCRSNICSVPATSCPKSEQTEKCDPNGKNCQIICKKSGCGCQSTEMPTNTLVFSMLLLFLFSSRRRIKSLKKSTIDLC